MDSPHPRHRPLIATAAAVLLSTYTLMASADDWRALTPSAPTFGTGIVVNHDGVGARDNTRYRIPQPDALLGGAAKGPAPGFLNRAFRQQEHTGKLGRVVDALGLGAIYNNPIVRTVLGRVHGSRFCLTDGCGINLKLSLRKPGLRFEHRF